MTLEAAIRATEILMALAFIQQSAEHLKVTPELRWALLLRIVFCLVLLSGGGQFWPAHPPLEPNSAALLIRSSAIAGLSLLSLLMLHRFQGPYNGGSDKMSLLILWCLLISHLAPTPFWQAAAFGYLAVQLTLSYFVSGWVKLLNREWRSGRALRDVFAFSAYPVSEDLRILSNRSTLCWIMSWGVILFEVLFPLSLIHQNLLIATLLVAAMFHLANACLFGLNRFFWIWLTAYPSLLWFQAHVVAAQ